MGGHHALARKLRRAISPQRCIGAPAFTALVFHLRRRSALPQAAFCTWSAGKLLGQAQARAWARGLAAEQTSAGSAKSMPTPFAQARPPSLARVNSPRRCMRRPRTAACCCAGRSTWRVPSTSCRNCRQACCATTFGPRESATIAQRRRCVSRDDRGASSPQVLRKILDHALQRIGRRLAEAADARRRP